MAEERIEMTKALSAIGVIMALCTPATVKAEYPFVGKWNCQGGIFTFTNLTYSYGGNTTLHFNKLESYKGNYKMTFPDGYELSLLNVKPKTMTWHSLASGDTFKCRRIKK